MHNAAYYGRLAELKLMIELAPERINETDSSGSSAGYDGTAPLHCAAQDGREAAVSLLLSAKADVNATTRSGSTPLGYAKSDRMKQLLRDAGGH